MDVPTWEHDVIPRECDVNMGGRAEGMEKVMPLLVIVIVDYGLTIRQVNIRDNYIITTIVSNYTSDFPTISRACQVLSSIFRVESIDFLVQTLLNMQVFIVYVKTTLNSTQCTHS
jgi:hypothetical protein